MVETLRRNVIVTGASRGIGLAITQRLAVAGYRVLALARRSTDALDAAAQAAGPGEIRFASVDLEKLDAVPGEIRGAARSPRRDLWPRQQCGDWHGRPAGDDGDGG